MPAGDVDDETIMAAERAASAVPTEPLDARVVFGFDGYVDRVREVVADRQDPDSYDRLATLAALSDRLEASVARDSSLSFEWRQTGTRTGGHSAHLSRVYRAWGFDPVMVGHYGDPERPVFAEEFADCERHTLGEPSYTDAVEFDDGKLMLMELGDSTTVSWSRIEERVGRDVLRDRLDGAAVLGAGYWAETPAMPDILDGIRALWGELEDPPEIVLLDPGDVRKLDVDRLRSGRSAVSALAEVAPVVVSANRAETHRLAEAFDEAAENPDRDDRAAEAQMVETRVAFDALGVDAFVTHGVDRSVAVTETEATSVAVPRADDPALTTSAGDHFNAGLALGHLADLDPGPAVALGNATANVFVRTGETPTLADVRSFLAEYESYF